ncbi:hypothetical protein E2C01_094110 [Portunus trituberculatus]|uniref:Uncharacterized protein n=1 Tax=Portunus trituberculatus TaxID=210409 RepID=A0A5B7JVA9_PORTR|nr:hypothetical protein [Portunus trituberculatus]
MLPSIPTRGTAQPQTGPGMGVDRPESGTASAPSPAVGRFLDAFQVRADSIVSGACPKYL